MTLRLLLVAILGLTFGASRAFAGEPPVVKVRPGAVATVIVTAAAPAEGATARFSIEPAADVRILGATEGALPENGGLTRRIPVTLTVPALAPAGPMVVGTLTVRWADGSSASSELLVEVEVVRRVVVRATPSTAVMQPGGAVRVTYQLSNQGNEADTIHLATDAGNWSASPTAEAHVIPAGASVDGSVEISAPRSAPLGEQRMIRLHAEGRGSSTAASVVLVVADVHGDAFGLAHVPANVFIGSSTEGGANVSLTGGGSVGRDSEVNLAFRRIGSPTGQTFGQTDLWGPRQLLSVRHRGTRAEAGDVSLHHDGIFSGAASAGSGLQLRHMGGSIHGGLLIARPRSGLGGLSAGRLVQGEFAHQLGRGTASARVLDFDAGVPGGGSGAMQIAGLGYVFEGHPAHQFALDAGLVRQGVGSSDETYGAAFDGRYAYSTPGLALSAQLRRMPDQLAGTSLSGDLASVAGSAAILRFARVSASGFSGSRTRVDGRAGDESRGVSTGVQLHGGESSIGLAWSAREHQGAVATAADRRSGLSASFSTRLGRISLRSSAETAVVHRGEADPYDVRRLRSQLRWSEPGRSAWVSVDYTDENLFRSPLQGEFGMRLRLGELNLDAAIGANAGEAAPELGYLRAGAEMYVSRTISLVAGVENNPSRSIGSPWTVSFGIRRALSLPLPMRDVPAVSGVVFEDRNGNGRRDRNEPGLEGVRVSSGAMTTMTGREGRFTFPHELAAGSPLQMDLAALGETYIAHSSEVLLPASGRVNLPVMRAASLDLVTIEPRDANQNVAHTLSGRQTTRAVVVLTGASGRTYPQALDSRGAATFAALPPGEYGFSVMRDGKEIATGRVQLAPGEHTSHEIEIVTRSREIRMLADSPDGGAL